MVGALTLSQTIEALPAPAKFFLTAIFAALGNLVIEYIRVRWTAQQLERVRLEKQLEAESENSK